ncbi:uncharacterized protein [Amphiura filiformis]|uniref:uncharacterized protein n=1 Tax=Amphiura filiformis TaxID=82378 RepID=UPI003B21C485
MDRNSRDDGSEDGHEQKECDPDDFEDDRDITKEPTEIDPEAREQLQSTLEDTIVRVICRSVLPLQELLDKIGGVQSWQRKASLLLLHAGSISTVPSIFHFLRFCRDFTTVLLPHFPIEEDMVAALAELGDTEEVDPLATNDVFDFISGRIDQLMEDHSDVKSTRYLQQLQCMFYAMALESNPDTPVLDQILQQLVSDTGVPIAGARPVLYRIIKTDIEEYELPETGTPVCESIIQTGQITDKFPNLKLLDCILRGEDENDIDTDVAVTDDIDNHLAVISCDILEDIAFEYLSADRIRRIKSRDDKLLETAIQSVRVFNHSSNCDLQTLCAIAFVRAFLKSAAEVLSNPKASIDVRGAGPLNVLGREINNLLGVTDEGLEIQRAGCLRIYLLKMFRRQFSLYKVRDICTQLQETISVLKELPWKKELFKTSRLVYNPMTYVERYSNVIEAMAEFQMQNKPSKIMKIIKSAKAEESYRLGLLAVMIERFFIIRSVTLLTDTDKQQAKMLLEKKEAKQLDTVLQVFMKHLSGIQDFKGPMQLNETTNHIRLEQVSVITHVACLIMCSEATGFQEYLRPTGKVKTLFLPGMGQFVSVWDGIDTKATTWNVKCPSCKSIIAGKLSDKQPKCCPVCNTKFRTPSTLRTQRGSLRSDQDTPSSIQTTGYTKRTLNEGACPDITVRSLSPVAYRMINIVLHGCFLLGVSMGIHTADEVNKSLNLHDITTSDEGPMVLDYLWKKLDEDWSTLGELLQVGSDNTALFFHSCLQQAGDILKTSGQEDKHHDARDVFEKEWSFAIDKEVKSRFERINTFKKKAFESMGSQQAELEHEIEELLPVTGQNTISRQLRQKGCTSYRHFRASMITQLQTFHGEHMFLRLLMSKEMILSYVRHLQNLLQWSRMVSERLDRRIERREGSRTIHEFLANSHYVPSDEREKVEKRFKEFQTAWNSVRDGWTLLTGSIANFEAMSLDRPVSASIMEQRSESNPLRQMIKRLMDIQNQFLQEALCIAASGVCPTLNFLLKDTAIAALPTATLEDSDRLIIQYKWNDDYLIFCDVNTEYGKGMLIQYDYTAIERELVRNLVLNKAILTAGETFTRFAYSDELFHACSTILLDVERLEGLPQQKLPKDVTNAIVREDGKDPNFTKNLLEHLEVLLLFLKKTGGKPEQSLNSFIKEWSAILPRSFPGNLLPKPRESIKLRHVISLYETLEDLMANNTISSLQSCYRTPLKDDTVVRKLTTECTNVDVDHVDDVLGTIRRFVFRYLRSGITKDPNNGLVSLMKHTAVKTLRCGDVANLIPEEVTVGHLVDVLNILDKQVEQRKDVTDKIRKRNQNPPTRQAKVQISHY